MGIGLPCPAAERCALGSKTLHNELEQVPKFTILECDSSDTMQCIGFFDSKIRLGEGYIGYLIDSQDNFAKGTIHSYDELKQTAIFRKQDSTKDNFFVIGNKYFYLDGYWGERTVLVLDSSRKWEEKHFITKDAMEYLSGGNRIRGKIGKIPYIKVEGEEKIIVGGWDHEHCAICWETISEKNNQISYTNQNDEWVCEPCYMKYITINKLLDSTLKGNTCAEDLRRRSEF